MNGAVMGEVGWLLLRKQSFRRPTPDGRPKQYVGVISAPIVVRRETGCLLGNAAVMAEAQKGKKMGQRLKIQ